jgi:putative hydrolase of the HAD superfamily
MASLTYKAVVFDLYGTLVPEFPRKDFFDVVRAMARELGADEEAFEREWRDTAPERQTGRHPTVASNVQAICDRLEIDPPEGALERAMALRAKLYDDYFDPEPEAEDTLRTISERGLPIGLISMCAPDTPELWRASTIAPYVDATVFSCEVGLRKPNPDIYLLACEQLGVLPEDCLYVGDGAYGELAGAAAIGMHPVLIRDPHEEPGTALRPDEERWEGPKIGYLHEVIGMIGGET